MNLVTGMAWATGEFSKTCTDIKITHNDDSDLNTIGKPILSAYCQKLNGSEVETSLDLNPYIGNVDGVLAWAGSKSNFGLSCYDLTVSYPGTLEGVCLRDTKRGDDGKFIIPNPKEIAAFLDLDEHIVNRDGTLQYE